VGLYNSGTKTIYLSEDLPRFSQGTMRSVLEHETVHAKLDAVGIQMPQQLEEALATLISVMACPSKYQSTEEAALKSMMSLGRRWERKADRAWLIRRACRLAGITPNKDLTNALK
jgi:hypothetical protein